LVLQYYAQKEEDFYMKKRQLKIYSGSGRNYTHYPQIIIQGKWLRPLGYFIGDKVTVTQDGNRLIIEKSEDGHDAEEEAAMVAEPAPRYNDPLRGCMRAWL
jgi:hypothetical protein